MKKLLLTIIIASTFPLFPLQAGKLEVLNNIPAQIIIVSVSAISILKGISKFVDTIYKVDARSQQPAGTAGEAAKTGGASKIGAAAGVSATGLVVLAITDDKTNFKNRALAWIKGKLPKNILSNKNATALPQPTESILFKNYPDQGDLHDQIDTDKLSVTQPSGTQPTAEPKKIPAKDGTLLTGDAKPDSTPNNNTPATTPSNGITAPTSDEKSTTTLPTPPVPEPATQPASTQPKDKNVASPKDTTESDNNPKNNTSATTPPSKKGDSKVSAAYNKVASIVKKATTPFTNNQIITKHPHITKAVAVGVAAALGYTYYIYSSEQDSVDQKDIVDDNSEGTKLA